MVNFDDTRGTKTKERSFFPSLDKEENTNEDYEVSFHQPEKKRRLLPKQVQFLEKSFEVENKLEPERKIQLAKETGLQPRQVAIWFQNRRARYKSKQLEKDYDVLKASFDKLKDEYDSLFKENDNLRNEVLYTSSHLTLFEYFKIILFLASLWNVENYSFFLWTNQSDKGLNFIQSMIARPLYHSQ